MKISQQIVMQSTVIGREKLPEELSSNQVMEMVLNHGGSQTAHDVQKMFFNLHDKGVPCNVRGMIKEFATDLFPSTADGEKYRKIWAHIENAELAAAVVNAGRGESKNVAHEARRL